MGQVTQNIGANPASAKTIEASTPSRSVWWKCCSTSTSLSHASSPSWTRFFTKLDLALAYHVLAVPRPGGLGGGPVQDIVPGPLQPVRVLRQHLSSRRVQYFLGDDALHAFDLRLPELSFNSHRRAQPVASLPASDTGNPMLGRVLQVYCQDILIFSMTCEGHLVHVQWCSRRQGIKSLTPRPPSAKAARRTCRAWCTGPASTGRATRGSRSTTVGQPD